MTDAPTPQQRERRAGGWWAAAVALLLITSVLVALSLSDVPEPAVVAATSAPATSAPATPVPASPVVPTPAPVVAAGAAAPAGQVADTAVPRGSTGSTPVGLSIPSIGVAVPLTSLGLNPDRTVEVPTDFQDAGWFRPGPVPGEVGSAVILGHVDSVDGPAVFYRLSTLAAGDRIDVTRSDGSVARFAVTAVTTYPKDSFPARAVYGSRGREMLNLVTCGGVFDQGTRRYLSNVVAYSSLVAIVGGPG